MTDMLSTSKDPFSEFAEMLPVGLFLTDLDGQPYYWNDFLCRMTGRSNDEIDEGRWIECIYPADRQTVIEHWMRCIRERGEFTLSSRIIRHDSEITLGIVHAKPRINDAGETVGYVGTITVLSEGKPDDHTRQESERVLKTTFEQAAVGMAHVGLDGRWILVNQKLCDIIGYNREELLQKTFQEITHPDDLNEDLAAVEGLLAGRLHTYSTEKRYFRKDGCTVWINLTVSLVRDDSSEPSYFISVIEDISGRKHTETENALLERQLNQAKKLESIGTLAAGIAHEINTPIQFIGDNISFFEDAVWDFIDFFDVVQQSISACDTIGDIEAALRRIREKQETVDLSFYKEELPQAIPQTMEGVQRVAAIVRAMKEFSHMGIEAKALEDINKAIESTVIISRNEWKYTAEVKTNLAPNLPLVACVIGDIKQVILNLVINASHAIKDCLTDGDEVPEKGVITIATQQTGTNVLISVKDSGVGIAEDACCRVFDPFFTTKVVGRGTGQGLAMAYTTVVEKHKGKISFDTEVGVGTTFFIELPIGEVQQEQCPNDGQQ